MTLRIYLGDEYSHFEKGSVIFDDGREEELQAYLHRGMTVDTLLLGIAKDMSYGDFLLRWRIYPNSLKIYDVDPKVKKIIWINESSKHIRIERHGPIAPGDTLIIQLNDT